MKPLYRQKKFICPFYRTRIILINTDDYDRLVRKFDNMDFGDHHEVHAFFIRGIYHERDGAYHAAYLIFNTRSELGPMSVGTVAHECLHAVGWILSRAGVKYDTNNDEAWTYFLDWLVDISWEFLQDTKD